MVAVSYDSQEVLAKFSKRAEIGFPLLSDPESKVIDAFGVRNEKANEGRTKGIPHPGTFLIDKDGKITAKLFYSIRKRHSPEELLNAVQR